MIQQNSLELRYRDGRIVRMSVYAAPEEASKARPQTLYFNAWDCHLER